LGHCSAVNQDQAKDLIDGAVLTLYNRAAMVGAWRESNEVDTTVVQQVFENS